MLAHSWTGHLALPHCWVFPELPLLYPHLPSMEEKIGFEPELQDTLKLTHFLLAITYVDMRHMQY